MRWAEMAAFTPVMRTHEGNRPRDNLQIDQDPEVLAHFARMTRVYVHLVPYLKSLVDGGRRAAGCRCSGRCSCTSRTTPGPTRSRTPISTARTSWWPRCGRPGKTEWTPICRTARTGFICGPGASSGRAGGHRGGAVRRAAGFPSSRHGFAELFAGLRRL